MTCYTVTYIFNKACVRVVEVSVFDVFGKGSGTGHLSAGSFGNNGVAKLFANRFRPL